MAKKTKDSNLSLEERLEQALVPNWDELYKLPENWCWVKLSSISMFERGITFPASAKESLRTTTNIPCLRTANVQESLELDDLLYVDRSYVKDNPNKLVRENDIIMSTANSRELVGKTSFVHSLTEEMTFGGFIMAIRSKIDPKYLFYFLRLQFLNGKFMSNSTQTTNIANINSATLGETETPIPPLEEQKRIVVHIETLFAKLDEAKEKAQEVVDGFETRKAAILHKAFSGELTAKWREDNGISIETWKEYDLQSVCSEKITDGTHKTPIYSDSINGIPFLSSKDVTSEKIDWTNIKYIDAKLHEELYARLSPQVDDVLLAKNGTTGVAALVDVEKVFDLYVTLAVLRPNKAIISPKFLHKIVNSPICKTQFNNHLKGIGVPNLHLRDIKKVIINVPTLPEQEEIARILEKLIVNEQKSKETAETVIEQIDIMKKAILARAFRGELGTNDPSEESAVELLKSVLTGGEN